MEQKSDPRTRNWFMMNSPFPTIALSAAYIITVKVSIYLLRRTSLISIFAYINLLWSSTDYRSEIDGESKANQREKASILL